MFQVGLIDRISKPIANIQRQFGDLGNSYRDGTHTMITGAAGVAGAGFALQAALMPAIEMDRVLGEVKSLGVANEQLQQLSDTALNFAVEYGKSATEFVAASYDIQSAIAGLAGNELSEFTRASAVLAAATKADMGTITNYVGTMYGIFQNTANAMGKADWVNMLSGQTAKAVQMFKTTGSEMSSAFTSVGASATSVGVGMTEQMAILGTLQATMSGSEAGTKYRAFLAGAAKAQTALNMTLTDSKGDLLPIFEILNKIKDKYGETISVAEADQLSKAFGSQEAVAMVQLLMQNTNGLAKSIDDLGNVKGIGIAEQMAGAMTDQWERLENGLFAVRVAFGQVLLPAILPVVESMANGANAVITWTRILPNITKYLGFTAVAFLGLVAAGGMFTLMLGLGKQAVVSYMMIVKTWSVMNALLTSGLVALRTALFGVYMMIVANPIILIVAAVVAAIAAIGALVYYWNDLKASFGDTTWFQILEGAITLITAPFMAAFELVKGGWQWVMSGFTDTSGFNGLFAVAEKLRGVFGAVFGWITEQFGKVWSMAKSVMSLIPGMGGDDETGKSKSVQQATPRASIPQGGAARNIASYTSASTSYGPINMNVSQMNSPQDFASEMEMVAG
ncbi:phage tail tape measure protein [Photobacterium phosphoreum]|uniref:Phage tail tape measure protein n=1 Tax=Photobacterium phosphoreum TaxID=659 RepID=A0AAW4ZUA0_PHOPO|nr:phage tail tape measure protein [Photobacterium phosphoreum]MCD9491059.1 phage tail tape measure protein [Photobacterium phosphoreum]MCF2190331.1 phage tail tape measure protein [Photobacterium phosphoreum]MCF2300918.1 phage tail tape measure protein [Photobacterium phosphoreum]